MNTLIKFGNQLYLVNQVFKGTVLIANRSLIRCGLWVFSRDPKLRFIYRSGRFSYERKHFCDIKSLNL